MLNTDGYIDLVPYWAPKVRRYVFPYLRVDFNSLGDRGCAFVDYYNRKNNVAIVIQYCILFVYNTVLYKRKENANQLGYTSQFQGVDEFDVNAKGNHWLLNGICANRQSQYRDTLSPSSLQLKLNRHYRSTGVIIKQTNDLVQLFITQSKVTVFISTLTSVLSVQRFVCATRPLST